MIQGSGHTVQGTSEGGCRDRRVQAKVGAEADGGAWDRGVKGSGVIRTRACGRVDSGGDEGGGERGRRGLWVFL